MMAKLRLLIELDYDADVMHGGDAGDAADYKWFYEQVLGEAGELSLHSNLIDDEVGTVKVLSVEAAAGC